MREQLKQSHSSDRAPIWRYAWLSTVPLHHAWNTRPSPPQRPDSIQTVDLLATFRADSASGRRHCRTPQLRVDKHCHVFPALTRQEAPRDQTSGWSTDLCTCCCPACGTCCSSKQPLLRHMAARNLRAPDRNRADVAHDHRSDHAHHDCGDHHSVGGLRAYVVGNRSCRSPYHHNDRDRDIHADRNDRNEDRSHRAPCSHPGPNTVLASDPRQDACPGLACCRRGACRPSPRRRGIHEIPGTWAGHAEGIEVPLPCHRSRVRSCSPLLLDQGRALCSRWHCPICQSTSTLSTLSNHTLVRLFARKTLAATHMVARCSPLPI
eukprot:TRINITY_DN6127_c0_g1_i3.p1 TRINITY_DN6127_c0_g1~~TRINITY_DN6127_c0_g1_i3.p1  ORF type:complete len:321 (+),score=-50.20 TRINITY_DN6127_c0_g1_i3:62-1024(+)